MQRVKVGVIGAGGIAQIEHIPNLSKLKRQFEILGVCDPSAKARAFVSEEFGLKVFATIDEVLALPLDAVVIASPDPLHHEHILAALGRGLCFGQRACRVWFFSLPRLRSLFQPLRSRRPSPSRISH